MEKDVSTNEVGTQLGTLSIHLEGVACRVNCEYCYLGARPANRAGSRILDPHLIEELVKTMPYQELAVSLSEPVDLWQTGLKTAIRTAKNRGKTVAVTTTLAVARNHTGLISEADRINLSVDPAKGPVNVKVIQKLAADLNLPTREVALIVTMSSPTFCDQLASGMLEQLLNIPQVDALQLNGIKPPPAWCNQEYWMGFLARIQPLVERYLDRRLFMDCYVHARFLNLGGCPARPDVSPGAEFRACVYQKLPDLEFQTAEELEAHVRSYVAPAVCPFPLS